MRIDIDIETAQLIVESVEGHLESCKLFPTPTTMRILVRMRDFIDDNAGKGQAPPVDTQTLPLPLPEAGQ